MAGLGLEPGHPQYRRAMAALFLIGISTFGMMYTVQPLLVTIGAEFARGATETSLLHSTTTAAIALTVIPLGHASARIGRAVSMRIGLGLAALTGIAAAVAPTWQLLLLARGIMGVGLAFILVSAMAWAVDEASPWAFGRMGGLYISGTTLGGVFGRLSVGLFAEIVGWRGAILTTSLLALATGIAAHWLLPRTSTPGHLLRSGWPRLGWWAKPQNAPARAVGIPAEHEIPARAVPEPAETSAISGATAVAQDPVAVDPAVPTDPNRFFRIRMIAVGGLGMAAFVGIYNVTTYRVAGEPFLLGPGFTGLLFLTYLSGTVSSAFAGRWAQKYGYRRVMIPAGIVAGVGLCITLIESILAIIIGLLVLSAGFFTMHSIANSATAKFSPAPSTSAAYYSLMYYVGSSTGAILLGVAWDANGWAASVLGALLLFSLAVVAGAAPRPIAESASRRPTS